MAIEPVSRRGFLKGLTAFIAAPAIMRVAAIMPISVQEPWVAEHILSPENIYRWINIGDPMRLKRLTEAGYTVLEASTKLMNLPGVPAISPHLIASRPYMGNDGKKSELRMAYIPQDRYIERETIKQDAIDLRERALDMRPVTDREVDLGNGFYVPKARDEA